MTTTDAQAEQGARFSQTPVTRLPYGQAGDVPVNDDQGESRRIVSIPRRLDVPPIF